MRKQLVGLVLAAMLGGAASASAGFAEKVDQAKSVISAIKGDSGSNPAKGMPASFELAKSLMTQVYPPKTRVTFYCGCKFAITNPRYGSGKIMNDCGYVSEGDSLRANRTEVEHLLPAENIGRGMACWRKGGRAACKKDPDFAAMEGDLHNLVYAVGEVNKIRSNFDFTDMGLKANSDRFGKCDIHVDSKRRLVQPPPHTRGQIARAYLYMSQAYGIKLSATNRRVFEVWHKQYPVSQLEKERHDRIVKLTGVKNPYIVNY